MQILTDVQAPPTASPGATYTTPTVVTTTTHVPASQLPQTGQHDVAWGALGLGLPILVAGVAILAVLRRRRARTE